MDAKKSPPPAAGAGAAPPPPASGYFSTVFSTPPPGNAKDAKHDWLAMLSKQTSRGPNGGAIMTDGKPQGRTTKDGKHGHPTESSESSYFGSSVHYGGREFYGNSPQKQPNEPPRNYKDDNPDGSAATRGDWWQGIKGVELIEFWLRSLELLIWAVGGGSI